MTRIILNDFAGHGFMLDLASALQRSGNQVGYQYCDTNLSPHPDFDAADVQVERISTRTPFEKYKVFKRVLSELEYGWASSRALRKGDVDVLILNNLPMLSLAAPLLAGALRRTQRVIWLQDVQSGLVAAVAGDGITARSARWVEGLLLRRADTVIAIADELADTAREFGVRPDRIHVIENWVPIDDVPLHPRDNEWSRARGLGERPRLVYSGTLARKHSPEVLSELAANAPDVDVVVVSEGVGAAWLSDQAAERGLTNLHVLPFQPFDHVPLVLASTDVLVALLTTDASDHSVPSKILSYMCAGRPILASIPLHNAAARMITDRARAGIVIPPGDTGAFVASAQKLLADPGLAAEMGAAGRRFAEEHFSSAKVVARLETIIGRSTVVGQ